MSKTQVIPMASAETPNRAYNLGVPLRTVSLVDPAMQARHDLCAFIKRIATQQGLRPDRLARRAGLSRTEELAYIQDWVPPTADAVLKLLRSLRLGRQARAQANVAFRIGHEGIDPELVMPLDFAGSAPKDLSKPRQGAGRRTAVRLNMPETPNVPPRSHTAAVPTLLAELDARAAPEFNKLLRLLQERSGRTPGQLAKASGIPRSSCYDMVKPDRQNLPVKHEHVQAFAVACGLTSTQVQRIMTLWTRCRAQQHAAPELPVATTPAVPIAPHSQVCARTHEDEQRFQTERWEPGAIIAIIVVFALLTVGLSVAAGMYLFSEIHLQQLQMNRALVSSVIALAIASMFGLGFMLIVNRPFRRRETRQSPQLIMTPRSPRTRPIPPVQPAPQPAPDAGREWAKRLARLPRREGDEAT
ncbi:hypothetical protein [Allokutzneria sp. NRRL B-24872]|uniref:hypothetical protein n=1 Tax=Allokutzneria sp. NRRL B-24872 TaxID=1137961 RepID=UPI001177A75E|nr:hypothetical protein [Allokutzneria sp. NRRL B-24872]